MQKIQQNLEAFNFQEFIQRRLKLGKAHYRILLTLGLIQANDGIQSIAISLLTPLLKEQLQLSQGEVSFFTSVFYIGVGMGALLSGIQSNQRGRRKALLLGTFIQLISSMLLALNISYLWLCVCRIIYGIGFGSTLAAATVIITQLMPINLRGRTLLLINFANSLGKLVGVGLGFAYINGEQKYIASYMLSSSVLHLLALLFSWLFVKQSFRFFLFKTNYKEAFRIIDQIIEENDKNTQKISDTQKQAIMKWSSKVFDAEDVNLGSIKLLSSSKKVVILLSISWFLVNFVFFGEMFIVPFMLRTKSSGLAQYFWMTMGEMPSLLLTSVLIQRKGWGRKNSLIAFFAISGLLCLLTMYSLNSFSLFLTKIFMKAIFQMMYPFTSESYSTSNRSIGFAINSFCGRVGASIMPFILFPLFNNIPDILFLILSIMNLCGALAIYQIKRDTFQKPLDQIKNQNEGNINYPDGFKQLNEEKVISVQLSTPSNIQNQK